METPSADDAHGEAAPVVLSSPAPVPRRRARRRSLPLVEAPSPLAEINGRLAWLEQLCERVGLATVSPRNRVLFDIVRKLDHMHDDLVALREWARVPRPECYPEPPADPTSGRGA